MRLARGASAGKRRDLAGCLFYMPVFGPPNIVRHLQKAK
jgi:hypothetical protein